MKDNKMKKIILFLASLILLSVIVNAQISQDITSIRCGDGVVDKYEMCEKGVKTDTCEKIGKIIGVASACWVDKCVCVPFVKQAFCGNDRREGIELCDGTGEDVCAQVGEILGYNLTCNTDKCICDLVGGVPASYYPGYNETEEEPEGMAVCGDGKLQLKEQCDPPNTLCTLHDDTVGICAKGCKCIPKESIGVVGEESNQTSNVTEKENKEDKKEDTKKEDGEEDDKKSEDIKEEKEKDSEDEGNEEDSEEESNEEIKEETEVSKKGFFKRLWEWIKDLFS